MEVEKHFLSSANQTSCERSRLPAMLQQVMLDLNSSRVCTLTEGSTTTHLKLVRICQDPEPVQEHQVPIFLEESKQYCTEQWDLTTHQILPYIDGFNHVSKIAAEADVDTNLVKACVQNLVYYGVVTLIPIFQYSNVYAATPRLRQLAENKELQERCVKYVSKSVRQPCHLRDVFRMYCSMTRGATVRDLCIRCNPHPLRINERKLVQFGVLEGLVRRVHKFPVCLQAESSGGLTHMFTGLNSMDEICCAAGVSAQQLEDAAERDPDVLVIWK